MQKPPSKSEIVLAKQNLSTALGPSEWKTYLGLLKQWFKRRLTKEAFDAEARRICLERRCVQQHNQLLLALFSSCNSFLPSSSSGSPSVAVAAAVVKTEVEGGVKPKSAPSATPASAASVAASTSAPPTTSANVKSKEKRKKDPKGKTKRSNKISFHNNFTPTNPLAYCVQLVPKPPEEEDGLYFSSRTGCLPDAASIHGRMLVGAWDAGLDAVDDAAVTLMSSVLETHVKSILRVMIQQRNSYRLHDGRFPTNFGSEQSSDFVKNAESARMLGQKRDVESDDSDTDQEDAALSDDEAVAAFRLASVNNRARFSGKKRHRRGPLNLFHLRDALQRHRNVVASHTVFSINAERIFNSASHSTREEEEAEAREREERRKRKRDEDMRVLVRNW